jgi:hypothetical protein
MDVANVSGAKRRLRAGVATALIQPRPSPQPLSRWERDSNLACALSLQCNHVRVFIGQCQVQAFGFGVEADITLNFSVRRCLLRFRI